MKFIFYSLFSLLLLSNCDATSQSNELASITYSAATRGSSISLIATTSELNYTDYNGTKKISLTTEQWNELKVLVNKIQLSSIQELEAPSTASSADRALIASLTINTGSNTYESSTFDHGNPPDELKKLIERLFEHFN
jgi:hypothetical protein